MVFPRFIAILTMTLVAAGSLYASNAQTQQESEDSNTAPIGASQVVLPGAPSNLLATPGDGQVSIRFDAGTEGSNPVLNYEYLIDDEWTPLDPPDDASPITIPGLTNDQQYTFRLRAVSSDGPSNQSGTVVTTPSSPPAEVLHNTPNNVDGGTWLSATDWQALLFTSAPNPSLLEAVDLGVNPPEGDDAPTTVEVEAALYSTEDGLPDTLLATSELQSIYLEDTKGLYEISFPANTVLDANTSYALVVRSDTTGAKWGRYRKNEPRTRDGFRYDGFLFTSNAGLSWTDDPSETAFDNAVILYVDPSPIVVEGQVFTYTENQAADTMIGRVSATDDVAVDSFTITSAEGADLSSAEVASWFTIDATGTIRLTSTGAGNVASNDFEFGANEFRLSITAIDDAGGASLPVDVTLTVLNAPELPTAPTDLAATPGDASVEIAFTPPAGGDAGIVNYAYQLDDGAWTPLDPADSVSPIMVVGLENNVESVIRIRAINAVGEGDASEPVSFTPRADPSDVHAFPADGAVTITFTRVAGATSYEYRIVPTSEAAASTTNTWTLASETAEGAIHIEGLPNATESCIELRARFDDAAGPASVATCVTPASASSPAAPTSVTTRFVATDPSDVQSNGDGTASVTFTYLVTNEGDDVLFDVWIGAFEAPEGTRVLVVEPDTGPGAVLTFPWYPDRWLWQGVDLAPGATRSLLVTLSVEVE